MSTYSRLIESIEWHFIRLADTKAVEPTAANIERLCDDVRQDVLGSLKGYYAEDDAAAS